MIQKMWRGYHVYKKYHDVLASCKYIDNDDFDYSGNTSSGTKLTTIGVDEAMFMVPEDLEEQVQFHLPSSFAVHSSKDSVTL